MDQNRINGLIWRIAGWIFGCAAGITLKTAYASDPADFFYVGVGVVYAALAVTLIVISRKKLSQPTYQYDETNNPEDTSKPK